MEFKHLVESEVKVLEAHLSNMENKDKTGSYSHGMAQRLDRYR